MDLLTFVKRWCIVSIMMFLGCLLSIYLVNKFKQHLSKLPVFLYAIHPISAHVILSELFKQGRLTLLNIVSVILLGNIVLKIREFLTYGVLIGIYILEDLWIYLAIVVFTYLMYLSILAYIFFKFFGIKNIELSKETIDKDLNIRKVLTLFLKVWVIYTIVYFSLTTLLVSNYLRYIIEFLRNLNLNPYIVTLLSTYMFSPVATWHFMKYFYDLDILNLIDVMSVFVIGRYLHFVFHVLRDGLPVLTTLYGVKNGLKIASVNIALLSIVYVLTYISLMKISVFFTH